MSNKELAEQTSEQIWRNHCINFNKDEFIAAISPYIRKALDQVREQAIKESEEWIRENGYDYYKDSEMDGRDDGIEGTWFEPDSMADDYRKAMLATKDNVVSKCGKQEE